MKWISVNDESPDQHKTVQMYGPKLGWGAGSLSPTDLGLEWFDDFHWLQGGGSAFRNDITHWKPLPDKPEA